MEKITNNHKVNNPGSYFSDLTFSLPCDPCGGFLTTVKGCYLSPLFISTWSNSHKNTELTPQGFKSSERGILQ